VHNKLRQSVATRSVGFGRRIVVLKMCGSRMLKDTVKPTRAQRRDASRKIRPATERTLSLLEALATTGRPASLKELSAMCELPSATAFRLCQRMEAEGYLVRDAGSRRYTIGVRLMRLGLDIVRSSGPTSMRHTIMSELVDAIGETCNLTTLAGNEVLYLDRVETRWPLRLALEPGSRVPIHCTASGKLFLSFMPDELRERILATLTLPRNSAKTIVDHGEFRRDLQRIAKRGYSTDNEEFLTGLVAVAVPVRDRKGHVFAAVASHAPVARMDLKRLTAEVPRMVDAAAKLAKTFDWD
jgi:DNA-binding IclR family transcriptional regulator